MAAAGGPLLGPWGAGGRVLSRTALAAVVAVVAVGAYANSLGNGFAMDDGLLVQDNPAVRQMDLPALLGGPWWPQEAGGRGLYRPLNALALSLQWQVWGESPVAFHAVSVAGHAAVSVLVFLLLWPLASALGALVGGVLFALHPVHAEAVATVVGQAETMAAGFGLLACILYLRVPDKGVAPGLARILAVGLLYFLALGSKEIAVTLPALFLVLAWLHARTEEGREAGGSVFGWFFRRVWSELPLFLLLGAALAFFLLLRFLALGSVTGVEGAPSLRGLTSGERILTAVSLWPQYARLLLFPFDLSSDYAPGVLFPARGVTPEVLAGVLLAVSAVALAVLARGRVPHLGAGFAWFVVAILPVSHLFFPVGVLLGERTLYLPSVGLSVAAAGLALPAWNSSGVVRRATLVGAVLVAVAFAARVVARNPVWESDEKVFRALARDHPESFRVQWLRAASLARRGSGDEAARAYRGAVALNPAHRSLLVEAAAFYGGRQEWARAEPLLRRAVELAPWHPEPFAHLAHHLILQNRYREAQEVALNGLARAGPDRLLWTFVSEAYIGRGRLDAAARARRAALSVEPGSAEDWLRLAQILEGAWRLEASR